MAHPPEMKKLSQKIKKSQKNSPKTPKIRKNPRQKYKKCSKSINSAI
jgi:hypothetical protein